MSDLRFRVALRNYLGNQTPANAEAALQAAIRAGIINTDREPEESPFGDWAIAFLPWRPKKGFLQGYRALSEDSQRWIAGKDTDLMRDQYVINIYDDKLEDDPPPQEVLDLLDAASSEGYDYLAFE